MAVAPFESGWQQRRHPRPQGIRNKISTHPDTLPIKIAKRKAYGSTHSETISYYHYGYYNLTGVSGAWRAYNNQTGTATMWLCLEINGTDCPIELKLNPGHWIDVYTMEYIKSIKLERQ